MTYERQIEYSELLLFKLFPLSGSLGTTKHDVSDTGSVRVLRGGGEETC
jgi:hypothetical protein